KLLGSINFNESSYFFVEVIIKALATLRFTDVSLGVYEDQGRPRAHAIAPPDGGVGIVHHGMRDLITKDRLANRLGLFLVGELWRMDADNHEHIGVLGFQFGKVRKRVDAVDATQCPKIEKDNAASEICQANRPRGVEPGDAAIQLGCGFAKRPKRRFFDRT